MSRLQSNAEPSMEEILASIRKIIAEEPPGSRGLPPPRNGTAAPFVSSPPQRGFMSREAFLKNSQSAEPEPSEPVLPSPNLSHHSAGSHDSGQLPSSASRRENGKASRDTAFEPVKPEPAGKKADPDGAGLASRARSEPSPPLVDPNPEVASIDAQLSELLSDGLEAMQVTTGRTVEPKTEISGKPAEAEQTSSPKVDRAADKNHESSDPFTFDLGPSPFAPRPKVEVPSKEPEPIAPGPAPAAAMLLTPTPTAESRPVELLRSEPQAEPQILIEEAVFSEPKRIEGKLYSNGATAPAAPPPAQSANTPILLSEDLPNPPASNAAPPPPRPESPSVPQQREPVPGPNARSPFAVPSVAATLGPTRKLEPLSESFRTPAPDAFRDRSQDRLPPPSNSTPLSDFYRQRDADARIEARQEPVDRTLQPSPAPPALPTDPTERSMEDAVADLLRPLLKTWLAENMPKIVERALRREMSERLLGSNQQNDPD